MFVRRSLPALAALAVLAAPLAACPFCSVEGQTFAGEVNQADFIVLGRLTNPQRDPNDFTKGTTDLQVEAVVKPHPFLAGKKTLKVPRYVPVDTAAKEKESKFLVFCSLYTRPVDLTASAVTSAAVLGNFDTAVLDAYRGIQVAADGKMAGYLKGAIEVRQKDGPTRLRYFFDYLDAPDAEISNDAMKEFGYADYKEVRAVAATFPADRVAKWLADPNTPAARYGLYGLFLGHCGKKENAAVLRKLLDDPAQGYSSGLDGLVAGYLMLDRPAGWDYLLGLLRDPAKEFPVRYAGLKVLRFLWEFRPDLVARGQILDGMKALVAQKDLADLPIEDLRKWGCWELTGFVLKFGGEESHNKVPIVRRAILRFALSAPADNADAAAYAAKARQADPERVKDVEQALKDEQPKSPAATIDPAVAAKGKQPPAGP